MLWDEVIVALRWVGGRAGGRSMLGVVLAFRVAVRGMVELNCLLVADEIGCVVVGVSTSSTQP